MGPGNDRRMIQITAPVQPGNSGGRVLDSLGNVVGVVEGWDVDFTSLGLSWHGGQRHDDGRHSAADCRRGRDYVAEVDPNPQLDLVAFGHVFITSCECALDLDRALGGIHRARKLDQHAVASGLDDATLVLGHAGIEDLFAERLELRQGFRFVLTHESAVADHIGSQDRR